MVYISKARFSQTGFIFFVLVLLSATIAPLSSAKAGEVTVIDVSIRSEGQRRYYLSTTLKHADAGWEHYADRWDVLDENGKLIGQRILHHPHVNEQPFTRSLSLSIPAHVKKITVRGHDSVHGDGPSSKVILLPKPK